MMNASEKLIFLQSLKERELCELVIIPLLEAMGYEQIRYTHGPLEMGKDIVFSRADPLEAQITCAAVVKISRISGSVSSSDSAREIWHQVRQAF